LRRSLALSFVANRFVYFPQKYPEGPWQAQALLHAADVWLDTADGVRIHAWWIPRDGASIVTLHLHGNGGNIAHRYGRFREIQAAGSAILALDYRGYGKSLGRPTERGLYRDADAGYDYLLKRGFRPDQIIVHGESLGTAVAVDLAARRPCAAVVLEAPFTSAKHVAQTVAPVIGPMLIWGFDSRAKIGRIHVPVFFIHGDRDEVIPLRLGQALFAAANEPKSFWLVPGAGHNDIAETAGASYGQHLRSLYERIWRRR
jgi:fermentation-respiration switch protein FrsA (DUF1100 family)